MRMHETRLFAAKLRTDLFVIDLHGLPIYQALDKLEVELDRAIMRGETEVKVVYGIGTGTLHAAVVAWLQKCKAIATIHEQGGDCIILLN